MNVRKEKNSCDSPRCARKSVEEALRRPHTEHRTQVSHRRAIASRLSFVATMRRRLRIRSASRVVLLFCPRRWGTFPRAQHANHESGGHFVGAFARVCVLFSWTLSWFNATPSFSSLFHSGPAQHHGRKCWGETCVPISSHAQVYEGEDPVSNRTSSIVDV